MHPLGRREFLKAAGVGIASFALPLPAGSQGRTASVGAASRTLVVIYLRGGMDALNTLVPYADENYYRMRPTLAIPPEDTDESAGVIHLDDAFGLNPALAALKPLWDAGKLAAIVNVGSPHPTRSHFDAQDFMEHAAPGLRTVHDGWLNRYLALSRAVPDGEGVVRKVPLRALAMQGLLPRALRGSYTVLAVPDGRVLHDKALLDLFEPFYGDYSEGGMPARREEEDAVLSTGRDTIETLRRFQEIVGRGSLRGRGLRTAVDAKLAAIGQVIRAGEGLEVAAIDLGGWDLHANQGGVEGKMTRLLQGLGDGLAAFAEDLGPHLERTLVVTMTEFGRTCRENGNYGTDHGHGGLMLLMGGGVAGGRVHGSWTGLEESDLYQSRDLAVTTDFRDVFASVLREHLGFEAPEGFFPDYGATPLRGLFGS